MTDYIRRLVSGSKARFKDDILNLELDLVYITDRIIIMGYPAVGVEGLYRNRREDAIKFLEHRHGKNFWVFNFCPVKENSYDASVFEGRVSRYPFPDHHAPPLAIMPLIAREMNEWLKGSPDRVAVLHCKAGKGRSGTMACTYLLSIDDPQAVQPPRLERNHSAKEFASKRMHDTVAVVSANVEDAVKPPVGSPPGILSLALQKGNSPADAQGILDIETGRPQDIPTASPLLSPNGSSNPERSFTDALKGVLDLHTARRMKPADSADKVKQGVSIPSQRRYLYYWALLLAHDAPKHLWAIEHPLSIDETQTLSSTSSIAFKKYHGPRPKVRLTTIKLRMRETSSLKMGVVKAANMVIGKTKMAKGPGTPLVRQEKDSSSSSSSSSSSASSISSSDDKESKKGQDKAKSSTRSNVWASIARYDDEFVEHLEEWEVYTRNLNGNMGQRRPDSGHLQRGSHQDSEDDLSNLFKDDRWDKGKMVHSFARMGDVDGTSHQKMVDDEKGKIDVYTLRLLSDRRWESLKAKLKKDGKSATHNTLKVVDEHAKEVVSRSEANSVNDIPSILKNDLPSSDQGLILDAGREVRIKLYLGQVFMGWLWFIPTFHMPQPPPTSNAQCSADTLKAHLLLTRNDLDFPLGIGSAIIDVDIEMEWIVPSATEPEGDFEPPVNKAMDQERKDSEPGQSQLAAVVQAVVGDAGAEGGGMRAAVEGKQGVEA